MSFLEKAVADAKARYERSGERQRVFKAYNLFHVRPADATYDGEHVAYYPEAAPMQTKKQESA